MYLLTGQPIAIGQRDTMRSPTMNNYSAGDGRRFWIVGLETERHWPALCRVVGRPEWQHDARYFDPRARAKNATALIAELDGIFASKPLDAWAIIFGTEPEFFWSPINTIDDVLGDEQFHAGGGIVDVPDGDGTLPMIATPVDFGGTSWAPRAVAPRLGEHTAQILIELNTQRTQ
jgi:crotonobetainyl-CoA:carnitine CoA-transferase CaiB-like acyl-CoA transferase